MPPNDALAERIRYLENTMVSMKADFEKKTDRMERRTIAAMNDFKQDLKAVESKVGRIMLIIAGLGLAGGAGGLQIVKALIGG